MNLTMITSVISAAAGFGLAWNLQAHQITKLELSHAQERIEIQRAARVVADRASTAVLVAQNNATARTVVLRRELDATRASATGLRDEIDIAMRASATSIDACAVAARTSGELLAVCADRYIDMAGKAQGHVSDYRAAVEACQK
jgi:hypothetical protein